MATSLPLSLLLGHPLLAFKGKRLELSTPNLVHVYSMAVARHTLIRRSKGQRPRWHSYENHQGCMAAHGCCGHCGSARRMTAPVVEPVSLVYGV